ncbi:cytochrome c oxidase subunit 1 [Phytophthora nicotianae INRA-310]|uniref:Cytochrome c oxidase subunit 1 n=1 Tax=Phytophthora nicotianae (strain INRA-310) TaxID=761204 RepID=W2P810_PHYN3|nr:cytochrome c oxidase subunit 1 [Phytophthora nicotianae INRA-310]ETM97142.1 cytochrome c oxidase subunit 1 [Phytophthora nicotianae INRA-310]
MGGDTSIMFYLWVLFLVYLLDFIFGLEKFLVVDIQKF